MKRQRKIDLVIGDDRPSGVTWASPYYTAAAVSHLKSVGRGIDAEAVRVLSAGRPVYLCLHLGAPLLSYAGLFMGRGDLSETQDLVLSVLVTLVSTAWIGFFLRRYRKVQLRIAEVCGEM
jgi:hypothetical protein